MSCISQTIFYRKLEHHFSQLSTVIDQQLFNIAVFNFIDLSSPENIISNSLDVERLANFEVETAYHTVAIMFIAIIHFFLR